MQTCGCVFVFVRARLLCVVMCVYVRVRGREGAWACGSVGLWVRVGVWARVRICARACALGSRK